MNSKVVGGILGAVILAAAAWFFAGPLFIDRAVDEPLELGGVPTRATIDAMPAAEKSKLMDDLMAAAEATPDVTMRETMDGNAEPTPVRTGKFSDADKVHKGSGSASIYALGNGGHLLRLEDFRVTNGPALVVVLATHPNPRSRGDVLEGYVELGKLKGNVGSQNYVIPDEIDIDEYGSVAIWCRLFDVLFAPAPLQ